MDAMDAMDAMQSIQFDWMLCIHTCIDWGECNEMHSDIDIERLESGIKMIIDCDIMFYVVLWQESILNTLQCNMEEMIDMHVDNICQSFDNEAD